MSNRLAGEKSPYLLQHAENPVDWYPWGEEAFHRARAEDKPVLVSIGYSACHWCHVMAHESFEDPATATVMNDRFVNIKVDREERPDVDAVYMEAVQALNGQGGWPLNVFLMPDGRPYFGGTYFPPESRYGMPSWMQVLDGVADAYANRRSDVLNNADALTQYVREGQRAGAASGEIQPQILSSAYAALAQSMDWTQGGVGGAPKFPQPLTLEFALRMWRRIGREDALRFVELTLTKMAAGGIYDQLGGGFHRYSVDAHWLVPHFEKMLYDNALLARLYVHAFQARHNPLYRRVAEETLDYLLREMRSPENGFYSAQDADSEGVEGKYYVWTEDEIRSLLPAKDAEVVLLHFGVRPQGNFEGKTILTDAVPMEQVASRMGESLQAVEASLDRSRDVLVKARSTRVRPGTDTKILVSWNALAIDALALGGRVLGRPEFLEGAEACARFLLHDLRPNGDLVRSYKDGPSSIPAFLEDYAFLSNALITLYETSFDAGYLDQARKLLAQLVDKFWDPDSSLYFDAQDGAQDLVVRPRGMFDNPIPSGNAAAGAAFLRMHALTGEEDFLQLALPILRSSLAIVSRAPLAAPAMLSALDFYFSTPLQIGIVDGSKNARSPLVDAVFSRYLPNSVLSVGEPDSAPLLQDRVMKDGLPTAYVCRHFTCKLPVTEAPALAAQLSDRD